MKQRRDLLAFGEVLWDIFEVGPDVFHREVGGAPANVCVHVARLGGRSAVFGAVGRDAFGEALRGRLERESVDCGGLVFRRERTGIAFVLRTKEGQPRFLFYRASTADMAYEVSNLPRALPKAAFALVGSSTLVRPKLRAATRTFARVARKSGANLVVDLNVRAHLWDSATAIRDAVGGLVRGSALIKASSDDLEGLGVGSEKRALAWVSERAPGATILVTRGAADASAFVGTVEVTRVRAPKARCVDATGAGDAFLAGVIRVLAARGPASYRDARALRHAVSLGVRLGSRAVTQVGAIAADTRPLAAAADRAIFAR